MRARYARFVEMHRKFDDSFKIMAVELSVVRGPVAAVAKELDVDPSLLSKWRMNPRFNGGKTLPDNPKISPRSEERRVGKEWRARGSLERQNQRGWNCACEGRRMTH